MQWYQAIFQTIDMRSFSSIWYWLAVVSVWIWIGHRVLGVPFDLVMQAHRAQEGDPIRDDLAELVRINAQRQVDLWQASGVAGVAAWAFGLSALIGLAVAGLEMAQALAFVAVPLTLVGVLRLRLAHRLLRAPATGPLLWHRMFVQIIAMVSIFATAIWGMFRNLAGLG